MNNKSKLTLVREVARKQRSARQSVPTSAEGRDHAKSRSKTKRPINLVSPVLGLYYSPRPCQVDESDLAWGTRKNIEQQDAPIPIYSKGFLQKYGREAIASSIFNNNIRINTPCTTKLGVSFKNSVGNICKYIPTKHSIECITVPSIPEVKQCNLADRKRGCRLNSYPTFLYKPQEEKPMWVGTRVFPLNFRLVKQRESRKDFLEELRAITPLAVPAYPERRIKNSMMTTPSECNHEETPRPHAEEISPSPVLSTVEPVVSTVVPTVKSDASKLEAPKATTSKVVKKTSGLLHHHRCDWCGRSYTHTHFARGSNHRQFVFQCPYEDCTCWFGNGDLMQRRNTTNSVKYTEPKVEEKRFSVKLGKGKPNPVVEGISYSQMSGKNAVPSATVVSTGPTPRRTPRRPYLTKEELEAIPWKMRREVYAKFPKVGPLTKSSTREERLAYIERARAIDDELRSVKIPKLARTRSAPVIVYKKKNWSGPMYVQRNVTHGRIFENFTNMKREVVPFTDLLLQVGDACLSYFEVEQTYVPSFDWALGANSPYKGKPKIVRIPRTVAEPPKKQAVVTPKKSEPTKPKVEKPLVKATPPPAKVEKVVELEKPTIPVPAVQKSQVEKLVEQQAAMLAEQQKRFEEQSEVIAQLQKALELQLEQNKALMAIINSRLPTNGEPSNAS